MEDTVVYVPLVDMTNLVFNSPEFGVVNYQLLRTLILSILDQLDIGDSTVEFRGEDMIQVQHFVNCILNKRKSTVSKPNVAGIKSLLERIEALENLLGTGAPIVTVSAAPEDADVEVPDLEDADFTKMSTAQSLSIVRKYIMLMQESLSMVPQMLRDVEELKKMLSSDPEEAAPEVRLKMLEQKLGETMEQLASLDTNACRQIQALQNRVSDMEREIAELLERAHLGVGGGGGGISEEMAVVLGNLQQDINAMTDNMDKLVEEKEQKQHMFDVLVEQVELLKTVKADREDLEDALADKADACQINRKVSFEQFDQACGDMAKTIEEALAKLTVQETLWNQALQDIQKNVGSKLDRMELNPLRDFINNKLKSLQEKFKTLMALKKEQEAAGTKTKFLKNVACISCDKDVVMRKEMDPTQFPKPYSLPPTRSMGPYLAYELDQLRKQQKCAPGAKNLNIFENALQSGKTPKSGDHICNRYCGGSHTVTTPQQRVTRLGHFLEQWGPELAPVSDTLVRGTDGKMYKARDDEFLKKLASEKGSPKLNEADTPHTGAEGNLPRRGGSAGQTSDGGSLSKLSAARGGSADYRPSRENSKTNAVKDVQTSQGCEPKADQIIDQKASIEAKTSVVIERKASQQNEPTTTQTSDANLPVDTGGQIGEGEADPGIVEHQSNQAAVEEASPTEDAAGQVDDKGDDSHSASSPPP